MITTSRVGSNVQAKIDSRTYALAFSNEAEAKFFENELSATQQDILSKGRDHCVRKKHISANPHDCTISMNFNMAESAVPWTMRARLTSEEETEAFFDDLRVAIFGRLPSI